MSPRCSCTAPPTPIVITGLDPVIHDFLRLDGSGGKVVDGRTKSDHDEPLDVHGDRPAVGKRPALAGVGFGTAAGSFGLASDTTVPGVSRYWPRTTTVSPALKPLSMSASPLSVSRTETGCMATL